jgi:hypothetical protein
MKKYFVLIRLNTKRKEYSLNILNSEIEELNSYSSSPLSRKLMSEIDLCNSFKTFENKSFFRKIILNLMSRKKRFAISLLRSLKY